MTAQVPPASDLWSQTVDRVKDRTNNRSLWETMEKAVGIAVENGNLIVGLNARLFNEAGHLTTSEHRNAIELVASQLAGEPLKLRVIEGDTFADWENTKIRDARVTAMREETYVKRDRQAAASQGWDSMYEYVARAFSSVQYRQLPQSKARYLTDMLYVLADAMNQNYPDNPDEQTARMLARVLDRVAQYAEVPPTIVALELDRLRAWQKQNPEQ
jgi:hypothetical protein